MDFLIVSGLSGAGKSSLAAILEDLGFYCVDNLPVPLIEGFASLAMAGGGSGTYSRVALVTDIRGGETFDGLFHALDKLEDMRCNYDILFVEADEETIIKRYKETRHAHPLTKTGLSLPEAVQQERHALASVRQRATHIINTSVLNLAKLRGEVLRLFGDGSPAENMQVSVVSFGFKYGIPIDADLVFDVRFLPNPYYIPALRPLSGLDEDIQKFLFGYEQSHKFLRHMEEMLDFLLPAYTQEGKVSLVIAIGCTGGRHRSVAITKALSDFIRQKAYQTKEQHRDMTRG